MTQSQDSGPSISIIFYEQTGSTLLILILREAELRSVETVLSTLRDGFSSSVSFKPKLRIYLLRYSSDLMPPILQYSVIVVFGEAFESARVKKT